MRWPGSKPQPVYVTALLRLLHLQPIAALEVLTCLADHLAGRRGVLETQVERWGDLPRPPLTANNYLNNSHSR